jgi:putative PIN family toxin of toxin-antitoxin system
MIIVIDTNVWISAFHFGGVTGTPFLAVNKSATDDTIATCREFEEELVSTLRFTCNWSDARIENLLSDVLKRSIRVQIHGSLHLCRDPGDDKFLECAQRTRADLLITGDKDLLSLRTHGRTRILTPAAYLKL